MAPFDDDPGDERADDASVTGEHDVARIAARARLRARAPMVVKLVLAVGVVSALAFLAMNPHRVRPYLDGELDWRGARVFHPPFGHRAQPLSLDHVHEVLLPRWVIARNERRGDRREERASVADRAYQELRYALGVDPNLVWWADEMNDALTEDPIGNASRIDYLLFAYNDYLDRAEVPWRIEASMLRRPRRAPVFATRSYHVLYDLRTEREERLRLLRRADLTNIVESYLGHSTGRKDGALVMMDRVTDFAVRHVWPAMHAGLDDRLPVGERTLARFVRREASVALSPALREVLHETAVDQLALIEVASSIHARHSLCGSSFSVFGLPWSGLSPSDRRSLIDALDRSRDKECEEVTLGEAARMIGASERLSDTPRLADAVEELVTWVARAVAMHELRHVRDGDDELACEDCPADLTSEARGELSAYLASFRAPDVGYVALMQACALEVDNAAMQLLGPHEQALAFALAHLVPNGCTGAPPGDLYDRAAELSEQTFGAREGIHLPEGYPRRIALLARPQLASTTSVSDDVPPSLAR